MVKNNEQPNIDQIISQLINLPPGTKEYFKCLEQYRWFQTGGETLGLNSSWEPTITAKGIVDINISKAL